MSIVRHPALLSALTLTLSLLGAESAQAQTPMRPFGARGDVVLPDLIGIRSGGLGFLGVLASAGGSFGPVAPPSISGLVGYDHNVAELPSAGATLTSSVDSISVGPSLDVFIANRISIGGMAGFAYGWGTQRFVAQGGETVERGTSFTVGVAPRVGYVIPLAAGFSLWPRAGVGFTFSRADTEDVSPGAPPRLSSVAGGIRSAIGVDLGLVFRPAPNIVFSAIPELVTAFSRSGQQIEGNSVFQGQSLRVRFGGTLAVGVLFGS